MCLDLRRSTSPILFLHHLSQRQGVKLWTINRSDEGALLVTQTLGGIFMKLKSRYIKTQALAIDTPAHFLHTLRAAI